MLQLRTDSMQRCIPELGDTERGPRQGRKQASRLTWELAPGHRDHEEEEDEGEAQQAIVEVWHPRNDLPSGDDA